MEATNPTTTTECEGCWDEDCPVCNPTQKTAANGWRGEPSKLHGNGSPLVGRNAPSDKQLAFLSRLMQERASYVQEHGITTAGITKAEASKLIDRLIKVPADGKTTGATDKQAAFIRTLGTQAGLNKQSIDAVLAAIKTPGDASKIIDSLKLDANNERMLQAARVREGKAQAAAPEASELDDAIYSIDGEVRKVYHTQSGQQVAKRWDGDLAEWEYIGKRGLRGLTAEHKMTLAQAVEFGSIYGRCCNCGRQLTDERSIEAGIGPVCAGRFA